MGVTKILMPFVLLIALSAVAGDFLTRNEVLAKLYSATRQPEAPEVHSFRVQISGNPTLEYCYRNGQSLLRESGIVTHVFDGKRGWVRGKGFTGGDDTWIFQFAFGIRPLPELFGTLKMFPEPELRGDEECYILLGRRNRYLTGAVVAVHAVSGLWRSVEVITAPHDSFQPLEFTWNRHRLIPASFRMNGQKFSVTSVEWNPHFEEDFFQLPDQMTEPSATYP